jgi:hypothetical protein
MPRRHFAPPPMFLHFRRLIFAATPFRRLFTPRFLRRRLLPFDIILRFCIDDIASRPRPSSQPPYARTAAQL